MTEIRKYLISYTVYDTHTKIVTELSCCIEAYTAEDAITQYKVLLPLMSSSTFTYTLISIGPYKEAENHGSN